MRGGFRHFELSKASGPDATQHLGHRLREIRLHAGLTQHVVAERLRIGQSALSRIENRSDVLISTLRDYLQALGATVRIDACLADNLSLRGILEEAGPEQNSISQAQLALPFAEDVRTSQRDVIFSIKPEYSSKIIEGVKTVELRRRFSKSISEGATAFIYSSSPTSAIICTAKIGIIEKQTTDQLWRRFSSQACISRHKFDAYFDGVAEGYAIELRQVNPLRRSLQLTELRERFAFEPPQSFTYANQQIRDAVRYECSTVSDRH